MSNKVKGRQGEELCVYLPAGKIAEVDKARGAYFTRSKFVLYALDRAIEEASSGTMRFEKQKIPQGASLATNRAPSGKDSSLSDISPNALVKESLANAR
jgi:hypothetical protein